MLFYRVFLLILNEYFLTNKSLFNQFAIILISIFFSEPLTRNKLFECNPLFGFEHIKKNSKNSNQHKKDSDDNVYCITTTGI